MFRNQDQAEDLEGLLDLSADLLENQRLEELAIILFSSRLG
jgi:hypothetical protein